MCCGVCTFDLYCFILIHVHIYICIFLLCYFIINLTMFLILVCLICNITIVYLKVIGLEFIWSLCV